MNITVYVKNGCVQCDMTKRTLENANLGYDTVNLDENPKALARVKQLGFLSAPVVITDTDAWAGFQPEKLASIQPHVRQQQQAASLAVKGKQSFSTAGQAPAQSQAGYAAPQYQQQQQLQQSQQATSTQMSR